MKSENLLYVQHLPVKKKGNAFTQMYCYDTEFDLLGKIHASIQSKCKKTHQT